MSETPDANQAGEAESFDPPASASEPAELRYGLNIAEADDIIDWIKRSVKMALRDKEPSWDQELYYSRPMSLDGKRRLDCGTTCCVAGYMADKAKVIGETTINHDLAPMPELMYHKVNHLGIAWEDWCVFQDEDPLYCMNSWKSYGIPWELVGSFFLGIMVQDARWLFQSFNSAEDLRVIIDQLKIKYDAA